MNQTPQIGLEINYIMDTGIKLDLDKECTRLLNELNKQHPDAVEFSKSVGITPSDLAPFVAGIVYVNFEIFFKDLYLTKGISQENRMDKDWVNYWQEQFPLLINDIKKIYRL